MSTWVNNLTWMLAILFYFISSFFDVSHQNLMETNASFVTNQYRTAYHFQPVQHWMNEMDYVVSLKFRTGFHFQPLHNWMNDPNAPMYYNGIYHIFYQYNPNSADWTQNITWGHSVSTDLVHWQGLEIALSPSEPFDINGCWSGSATILRKNKPVILYTSIDKNVRQVQSVAKPKNLSDPYLREWIKPSYNPVIEPFDGVDVSWFRDPSTAWVGRDGLWRVLVGTVIGKSGHAILYKSKDFVSWVRVEHPLYYTNGSGMWECVDFFPIGEGKYLLKVSFFDTLSDRYTIGRYDEKRDVFVGDDESSKDYRSWNRIDYGSIYASKTFYDQSKKRRILWAWSNESDSRADDLAKGWAGIQTIPRVLTLDEDMKTLIQWPIQELELLRKNEVKMQNIKLHKGGLIEIKGVTGSQADVEIEFELESLNGAEHFNANWIVDPPKLCREKGPYRNGGVGPFGLFVLASDDLKEHTAVYFNIFRSANGFAALMCADQRRSSSRAKLYKPASGGFVDMNMKKNGMLSLRTLIDHSVVESFGNKGRTCITSRVYPKSLVKSTHLYAFNNGTQTVKISSLKAWDMAQAKVS